MLWAPLHHQPQRQSTPCQHRPTPLSINPRRCRATQPAVVAHPRGVHRRLARWPARPAYPASSTARVPPRPHPAPTVSVIGGLTPHMWCMTCTLDPHGSGPCIYWPHPVDHASNLLGMTFVQELARKARKQARITPPYLAGRPAGTCGLPEPEARENAA